MPRFVLVSGAVIALLGGPAQSDTPAGTAAGSVDPRPMVWVLDGAGDFGGCSNALANASFQAGNPVEVATFRWSHGYRRVILDQMDMAHAREQGRRFAAVLAEWKALEPDRRVIVVSHSAGAAVSLSAGDVLPPNSVDRMILLAPSVSRGYDVGPSLRACREGIDVFCSKRDWLALGIGARVVGTTDRYLGRAAGRHGFRSRGHLDACCNPCSLRQHFWSSDMSWSGHTGGHFGTHSPTFVQTYLLPLMDPNRDAALAAR